MRLIHFIESYFWVFLLAGILLGLSYPVYTGFLMSLLKPLLMVMLLLVFLKTDFIRIIKQIRDYRMMAYLTCTFMLIIPLILFAAVNLFSHELAIGILLLTAMPAGVATPSLTDIVRGNIALSSGIAILTSIMAPFTVPMLFRLVNHDTLEMNSLEMFTDLAVLVFVPLAASQVLKMLFPSTVARIKSSFTSVNIIIIFIMVYAAMGSQRGLITGDPVSILWKVCFLYVIYILLHVAGYLLAPGQDRPSRIAITISSAYRNNGMAIVLAAIHFEPSVLVLMVLSEFPWSTLLAPFRKVMQHLQKNDTVSSGRAGRIP